MAAGGSAVASMGKSDDRALGGSATCEVDDDDADGDFPGPPRPLTRQPSINDSPGETADTADLNVEMDVQIGQMTLRSKHLQALPSDVANDPEVQAMFGDATIQASVIEKASKRVIYQLVGLNHEVIQWTGIDDTPPTIPEGWEREYDPATMPKSETWIVNIFESVREAFYVAPEPQPSWVFYLPEVTLPERAEVAVLLGVFPAAPLGVGKIVYVFRYVSTYNASYRSTICNWWCVFLCSRCFACLDA